MGKERKKNLQRSSITLHRPPSGILEASDRESECFFGGFGCEGGDGSSVAGT